MDATGGTSSPSALWNKSTPRQAAITLQGKAIMALQDNAVESINPEARSEEATRRLSLRFLRGWLANLQLCTAIIGRGRWNRQAWRGSLCLQQEANCPNSLVGISSVEPNRLNEARSRR